MQQAYPVIFTQDDDSIIVAFPDVPEAMTVGLNEAHALLQAEDALIVALSGYLEDKRDIPKPSKAKANQVVIVLPPLIASKLAIYQAMRDQNVSQSALAHRLHCDARQVRRLLDLDHHSRMDLIDDALHELGKKLVIDIRPLPLSITLQKKKIMGHVNHRAH
ncbi:MAG TPA: type II toxin-antitoxin system HicB family antitoxin [Gammaproteobacteria bacterium]|nr:type II toxin-antitoxin system HicB family antitoxin [Gammaproteobacteria bacterium]